MSRAMERTNDEVMGQIDAVLKEKGLDYPAAWAFMLLVDNEDKISAALSRAGHYDLATEVHNVVTWIEWGEDTYKLLHRIKEAE